MAAIDLNVIPLYRQDGREFTTLPGLHIANPPKRGGSRSRRNDQLILMLDFVPPAFSDDKLAELLTRLETMYYAKEGSTTSAMRELIEDLNTLILNLNLRHASDRPKVVGSFGVFVIRNEHFFLAQCGAGHLFALLPGKVDYQHDDSLAGRGLGISRSASVFYAQMPLEAGYKFLYTTELPDGWDAETFEYAYTNPLHSARRRFLEDSGEEIKGLILNIQAGSGKLTLQEFPTIQVESQPAPDPVNQPTAAPAFEPEEEQASYTPEADVPGKTAQDSQAFEPQTHQVEQPQTERQQTDRPPARPMPTRQPGTPALQAEDDEYAPEFDISSDEYDGPAVSTSGEEPPAQVTPRRSSRRSRESQIDLKPGLLKFFKSAQAVWQKIGGGLKSFLQRLVPGDELVKIPSSYMAFIAVIVPLVIVTISALVYAQIGRNQQYEFYFSEAKSVYAQADQQSDPNIKYQQFGEVMGLLDTAEGYLVTDELSLMREQTLKQLDLIDNITRLDFVPAIAGTTLSNQIQIRHLAATSRELYILDAASDAVFRAWLAGSKYEMDPAFDCKAGPHGAVIVNNLIDIAVLPDNEKGFTVVALDAGGNLMYCGEEVEPEVITLKPPDTNWGLIKAIAVENERLYVLDETSNMIWFYKVILGDDNVNNYQFTGPANYFFTGEVPSLKDTIDFSINREDLFLLYSNGQTTTCNFSGLEGEPASCVTPTIYNDTRPGKQSGPNVEGAIFYQLQSTLPPEPSLYYFDPTTSGIYHFSLRMNLVEQYRPQPELESELATAFTVSPTSTLFIAYSNQIYLTYLP